MEEHLLLSGRDTFLIAIPLIVILMITMFRLDQIIASPKGVVTGRRLACGVDKLGEPILRDPDGRLSGPPRRKRERSGLIDNGHATRGNRLSQAAAGAEGR
jgi:hypothetical protein